MREIEVEAKTVEEAISIAMKKLRVKRDRVEVKILNEESKGLFGMGGVESAKVKVKIKDR